MAAEKDGRFLNFLKSLKNAVKYFIISDDAFIL
jgi:hypothetical protein